MEIKPCECGCAEVRVSTGIVATVVRRYAKSGEPFHTSITTVTTVDPEGPVCDACGVVRADLVGSNWLAGLAGYVIESNNEPHDRCPRCGDVFLAGHGGKKFCSERCARNERSSRHRAKRRGEVEIDGTGE